MDKSEQEVPFGCLSEWTFLDPRNSLIDLRVALLIARYQQRGSTGCTRTNGQLAERLNLHPKTVLKSTARLIERGHVKASVSTVDRRLRVLKIVYPTLSARHEPGVSSRLPIEEDSGVSRRLPIADADRLPIEPEPGVENDIIGSRDSASTPRKSAKSSPTRDIRDPEKKESGQHGTESVSHAHATSDKPLDGEHVTTARAAADQGQVEPPAPANDRGPGHRVSRRPTFEERESKSLRAEIADRIAAGDSLEQIAQAAGMSRRVDVLRDFMASPAMTLAIEELALLWQACGVVVIDYGGPRRPRRRKAAKGRPAARRARS